MAATAAARWASIALLALAACSSSGTTDKGSVVVGPEGDSGVAPMNDAGVTTSGDTVTLTMGPFDVPPGTEVFKCQDFANPFGATDQDIKQYDVHMTPGSHHMFLFFNTASVDGPVRDCPAGGFEFHPYPFTSQTPDATMTYPDGVGSLVPGTTGFRVNAHYLNPGATAVKGTVTVTLHKAAPGTIKQHAGVIFMNDIGLRVPPGVSTSSKKCSLPAGINLMVASSHMHQRATGFTAKTGDGTTLYETDQWADPTPRVFAPALALPQQTDVTWGCTYDNKTTDTLVFGEYAATNVMCIFTAHYYPVVDPRHPTIDCEQP
jgi:Copper type II ascorbate-dependent monooxygenase, C-terminal domain